MKTENCTLKGLQATCGRPSQSCYMIQFHVAFTMVVPVEKLSNRLNLTQSSDSTLFHTAHQKKKTNKYYWHRTVHMYIIITGITSCFVLSVWLYFPCRQPFTNYNLHFLEWLADDLGKLQNIQI